MILDDEGQKFQAYLDGGPIPSDAEIKAFQKLIIRESKISRNNDLRQSYDYREPTTDQPTPNLATKPTKLNPPVKTKPYQDLLHKVINKKNESK